jgi:hypothetical protein
MCVLPCKDAQSGPANYHEHNNPYPVFSDSVINDHSCPGDQVYYESGQASPEQQHFIIFPLMIVFSLHIEI